METREAYKEIFRVLGKYEGVCVFDIQGMKRMADVHLYYLELKNKYGLNTSAEYSAEYLYPL